MHANVATFLLFACAVSKCTEASPFKKPKEVSSRRPSEGRNIIFPTELEAYRNLRDPSKNGPRANPTLEEIPLDLIHRLNNYTEVNDLLADFVERDPLEDGAVSLINRFAIHEKNLNGGMIPKSASCIPEMQTVVLAPEDGPNILYFPTCTRIERCGGCCSHHLLICQPTEKSTVTFQLIKTQFIGAPKFKNLGNHTVEVERHHKCKCDCKVKESDCNSMQTYRRGECRCVCRNSDEEKKCYKEYGTKYWNPGTCSCDCRNVTQCSTGYVYDNLRCRCGPVPMKRRFAELPSNENNSFDDELPGVYLG